MNVGLSEEQELLLHTSREILERECPISRVRSAMEDPRDTCSGLFETLAGLGWTGLALPTSYGGAGLGMVELAILLEQMGRVLLPAPFFSSAVLASLAIQLAGDAAQRDRWLPSLGHGALRATVALQGDAPGWDERALALPADPLDGGLVVSGVRLFVLDGVTAELVLVPVRSTGGELALAAFPTDAPGVRVRPMEFIDATRRVAELELERAHAGAEDVLRSGGPGLLDRLLDRGRVALCAEMCGGAARVLELSVEYARTREQFGRPIGSFQAIQHKCADMLVAVEAARSATYAAAWSIDAGAQDAHLLACMAKAYCSDAYRAVAGQGIQIHGGLGFTWEQDLHLYFKRARACEASFGDGAWNREQIARLLIDTSSPS
jgi:alkylation response protein AidB-like acyl-CoA dehydrogenase